MKDNNQLEAELEEEKDHSAFLEKLLRILYGEGWNKLTIDDAIWMRKTGLLTSNAADEEKLCKICGQGPEIDHNNCMITAMHR